MPTRVEFIITQIVYQNDEEIGLSHAKIESSRTLQLDDAGWLPVEDCRNTTGRLNPMSASACLLNP